MDKYWRFKLFRDIDYFLIFVFLVLAFVGIWYAFIECRIVPDQDKALALLFGAVGSVLGLFQFLFIQIKNKKTRNFNLRYSIYKDLMLAIKNATEAINDKMGEPEMSNPHGLANKLLNYFNDINNTVKVNQDFLFPGLSKMSSYHEIMTILDDIVVSTDKLRAQIEKINKNNDASKAEIFSGFKSMNWHNDMREKLEKLHKVKYSFYRDLRKYF